MISPLRCLVILPLLLPAHDGQPSNSATGRLASLRLDSEADRVAFRRWFTFLAEAQYFTPLAQRPAEIVDCSALVRYAFREALREHNSAWSAESRLPLIPAIPSVAKYNYPKTPVGPNLFRVSLTSFAEFADAETLYRYNVFFVGRDLLRAEAGDLLFYRHRSGRMPFHTMIVLGRSQITLNRAMYIVYDTGPDGTDQGEIKRLTFQDLLHFPDPQWQPIGQNPSFLGVFRWNILGESS
jgi:uncharacterized protein YfaT (DUF1175 family)